MKKYDHRIHDLLLAAARARGDALAIIDHDDTRYSWAEMLKGAEAARDALQARGVRRGDRVVIVLENAAVMLAYLYGASMLGVAACPVNARLSGPELGRIVERGDAAAAIFTVETGEAPRAHAADYGAEPVDGPVGRVAIALRSGTEPLPEEDDPAREVAILLYTSGTTGAPKGAMLSQSSMVQSAAASRHARDLVERDLVYLALPMSHVFGLATILAVTMAHGAARLEARFDVGRLFEALQEEITVLPAVPQMHAHLFHYARTHGAARYGGHSLRYVSSGGAPLDPVWKREAETFYGLPLQNGYGLTESSSGACMTRNALGDPDISVGVAMLDSELRVDLEAQGASPNEGIGEVEIGGGQVMLGYFRDEAATAAAITEDGWLRTGDLGRFDEEGRLHLVGRSKEMIIHSGFNVYPVEVEAALTEHRGVIVAAVVGRAVEGNEEVVAFVTCRPEAGLDEAGLQAFLRDRLAPYKVPSKIVIADALPAAPTGKILKAKLLGHFADRL
ncbi:class I adenylate-forming enzyme family protein [Alisedimentitalea sp. MJ-SS2]|uniref:class I adenylate-forming enzyme family protein n=1 Tax=Aliisedimentitalea sp. MJ-SS2 TaxID=3049795 RepID=UPI00290E1798|nr:class I adenylate-forming enzyme family protein [Alisedimentitalea sp. MJ-SS2]MDU8926726.1 class I adenylate-forming enzyme family protein [Alisedimentitalea sp. MJ-SS2]